MAQRDRQLRWVHEARGEDPDSWSAVGEDMMQELERTMTMLKEMADEEGVDLAAPLPPVPASLDESRMRRAGLDLLRALKSAGEALELADAATEEAFGQALSTSTTLVAKAARIAHVQDEDADVWAFDTVPNLLLIEHLRQRFEELLAAMGGTIRTAVERPLDELDRILSPRVDAITPELRARLEALVARGAAPSPFCIVES